MSCNLFPRSLWNYGSLKHARKLLYTKHQHHLAGEWSALLRVCVICALVNLHQHNSIMRRWVAAFLINTAARTHNVSVAFFFNSRSLGCETTHLFSFAVSISRCGHALRGEDMINLSGYNTSWFQLASGQPCQVVPLTVKLARGPSNICCQKKYEGRSW
jgi:hypothetical protein